MWTWQVTFYDPVSDRTFMVCSMRYFKTPEEAENDIVWCCEQEAFTQRGVPLSSVIHTAEAVYCNFGGQHGNER